MSPPKVTVSREQVRAAALRVLRKAGLAGLSARAVADILGTSVGPIYRAYKNMDDLARAALDEAMELYMGYARHPYTDMPFRDAGVGTVMFARDEPRLYQALFVERHRFGEIFLTLKDSILAALAQDEHLRVLPEARRRDLMTDMWVYTHGLAMLVISGTFPKPTARAVDRKLYRVGGVVIMAALAAAPGPADNWRPAGLDSKNISARKRTTRRKGKA